MRRTGVRGWAAALLAVACMAPVTACGSSAAAVRALVGGSVPTPLGPGLYADAWTATGRHIYAFAPDGAKWRYIGEEPQPALGPDEEVHAASPDESRFLVVRIGDNGLWSVDRSGGDRHLIVKPSGLRRVCASGFDPSGDRIYYGVEEDNRQLVGVYTAAPDGTNSRQVRGLTSVFCEARWSADGSTMVLPRPATGTKPHLPVRLYHLVKVVAGAAAGRDVALDLPDATSVEDVLAVSGDGRTIVVSTETPSAGGHSHVREIYLADVSTGAVTRLTLPSGSKAGLSASFRFDSAGRLLGVLNTQPAGGVGWEIVVFDERGQGVATLPNPTTEQTGYLTIWSVYP